MEVFQKAKAVKTRSHMEKYLVADDDRKKVRRSCNGSSRKVVWFIELVEGKSHAIRLKTCFGTYLTATDVAFLLVMTGCKVLQTILEKGLRLEVRVGAEDLVRQVSLHQLRDAAVEKLDHD
jgi:hypothetical protein